VKESVCLGGNGRVKTINFAAVKAVRPPESLEPLANCDGVSKSDGWAKHFA